MTRAEVVQKILDNGQGLGHVKGTQGKSCISGHLHRHVGIGLAAAIRLYKFVAQDLLLHATTVFHLFVFICGQTMMSSARLLLLLLLTI